MTFLFCCVRFGLFSTQLALCFCLNFKSLLFIRLVLSPLRSPLLIYACVRVTARVCLSVHYSVCLPNALYLCGKCEHIVVRSRCFVNGTHHRLSPVDLVPSRKVDSWKNDCFAFAVWSVFANRDSPAISNRWFNVSFVNVV